LRFLNTATGVPRKPVPLRYAVLITELDVGSFCALLSGELHYAGAYDAIAEPLLSAYELSSAPSALKVTRSAMQSICSQVALRPTKKSQLKEIPKSFYVWSNDLADAFEHYITLVPGRDNARLWQLKLNWNPSLGNLKPLIEECPNPENIGSPKSVKAAEVEKRNRKIIAEYLKQAKAFPHLSKSNIATRISRAGVFERTSRRVPQVLTPESIRRVINRFT
jgi:hypothetical protein